MAMRSEACATAREALPVEAPAPTPDDIVRQGEMEGVLHVAGEVGFRAASVRAVLEYSGGHRKQFYQHFDSLEDCFGQACEAWTERLGLTVLESALAVEGWRARVRAGIMRLFQFAVEEPAVARALFVEVHVAGGRALAAHREATEQLANALDSVRGELGPDEAPPGETGLFAIGGIDAYVSGVLADAEGNPNRIWDGLPELMRMVVGCYLDRDAVEAAVQETLLELRRGGGEAAERR